MKYIIWGTGYYCREKIGNFSNNDIVAFVERTRIEFRGRKTILPSEIAEYSYDYIVVLSSHYAEIILEMVKMGIDHKKIIPGINYRPFLFGELEYISVGNKVEVMSDGTLMYVFKNKYNIKIESDADWEQVRKLICNENNVEWIKRIDTKPVGKKYGSDRGGSICRYYLNEFLQAYKSAIRGKVLEVGDRYYTEKFGTGVEKSYVLHFGSNGIGDEFDFVGDLRDGKGIKNDFYDCIILTQVLDFVEDIRETPDILINALKPGGKLLISVSGISAICRYDMDKYGQYWNFTDKSIRKMFMRNDTECDVWTKGNCKVACAFLQGMSYTELSEQELQDTDEDFQVVIFAVVTRIM